MKKGKTIELEKSLAVNLNYEETIENCINNYKKRNKNISIH